MAERNILEEIVERRIQDMKKSGIEFGFKIPEKRQRAVHPFIVEKGVILEVKRASPSKGDIAPNLDSGETARSYAEAGAKAISCLTETNYFKGTLGDLMKVCGSVDAFEKETGKSGPAVLRKDFLINEQEVEVAYRAGADAVLLISRILSVETMISMAKKCEDLGITALIELRLDEDIEKLAQVVKSVDKKYIVTGVNSRDLKDFTIDLLTPCSMLKKIRDVMGDDARVVFESGIRTPESAAFAGSLGFTGMLLGEAAAKNAEIRSALVKAFVDSEETKNAEFWNNFAPRKDYCSAEKIPVVKICGLTQFEDAVYCGKNGADFLGFIFWNKSPRHANEQLVRQVKKEVQAYGIKLVGVIVDPDLEESQVAIKLCQEEIIDVLQVHTIQGARKFLSNKEYRKLPHYAAINISCDEDVNLLDELLDMGEPRVLVDAQSANQIGGTGKQINPELVAKVQKKYKLWLAGGINPENVTKVNDAYLPELIDVASGVEKDSETSGLKVKDLKKVDGILKIKEFKVI